MTKLDQYLLGEMQEHTIAPFFHLRPADTKESLKERLKELADIGICRVTVEYGSGGMELCPFDEKFYAAADELVAACRDLGMQFRLQDAAPFPTGGANGMLAEPGYQELNKIFVDERHTDLCGPVRGGIIRAGKLMRAVNSELMSEPSRLDVSDRQMLGTLAFRTDEEGRLVDGSGVRLDGYLKGENLLWDVPEGYWRVFVLFTTRKSSGRKNYINLLSRDSVRLQIDSVHAPIWEHLKDELGKTWIGFFYDEPEVGNSGNGAAYDFTMLPGRRQNNGCSCDVYPWSPEMPAELSARDPDWLIHLPYLWYDGQEEHAGFRFRYMDAVTCLIRDSYNGQVHAWCRERNIPYIGHILEDEGSHTRLGCGTGHFFRTEYYQDRAGVDLISAQVMPGSDRRCSWYGAVNGDGEFYHYGLAKLASSAARINPLQNGRSFCEVFAVYGHVMGPKLRKFLLDHLFINGVNEAVFADIQRCGIPEEYYRVLDGYTERMCRLLNHSSERIQTAVLYHAEAEWSGGTAQPFQKAAGELARHQLSYDILPADVFRFPELYAADLKDGLSVNGNSYEALVIPASTWIPEEVWKFIEEAGKRGFPVFFTDRLPEGLCGSLKRVAAEGLAATPLRELADAVRAAITPDVLAEGYHPWLRTAHRTAEGEYYYLFHSEAPQEGDTAWLTLRAEAPVRRIDPMTGETRPIPWESAGEGFVRVKLELEQFEMAVLETGAEAPAAAEAELMPWNPDWSVSAAGREWTVPGEKLPEFKELPGPEYDGCITYTAELDATAGTIPGILDLGRVQESAEVLVNGMSAGHRISGPYRFRLKGLLKHGVNRVDVRVYGSPVGFRESGGFMGLDMDSISAVPYAVIEPSGLFGPVKIG